MSIHYEEKRGGNVFILKRDVFLKAKIRVFIRQPQNKYKQPRSNLTFILKPETAFVDCRDAVLVTSVRMKTFGCFIIDLLFVFTPQIDRSSYGRGRKASVVGYIEKKDRKHQKR